MPLQATSGAASYDAFGGGVAVVPTYIEDVFSTYVYSGNSGTFSVVNGIDLSTYGGMLWTKNRTSAYVGQIYNSSVGLTKYLVPSTTGANATTSGIAFNTNGFTLGSNDNSNSTGQNGVGWSFRKQPKFFDIVTYTGNGSTQNIAHNLGSVPGCIIVKCTSTAGQDWFVYHRTQGNGYGLLNTTDSWGTYTGYWNNTAPTSTQFSVGTSNGVNGSGLTYVAYLFAHDAGGFGLTGTDNVISCGTFTTDGTGAAGNITLGYEAQWILLKRSDGVGSWNIIDIMRGSSLTSYNYLQPNASTAESSSTSAGQGIFPTATGFYVGTNFPAASATYIYVAIRRGPMKVPTTGTSVFSTTSTSTDTGTITSNFPTDMVLSLDRTAGQAAFNRMLQDRLRGDFKILDTSTTNAENSNSSTVSFNSNTGIVLNGGGVYSNGFVHEQFRRAPSFFDEVCYTGNNVSGRAITHNLAAVPQLMIVKSRTSSTRDWIVYDATNGATKYMNLNNTSASGAGSFWVSTAPTSTVFTVSDSSSVNDPAQNYVAYLFATCSGVSKVFSYTGNGSSQTINCGFTAGSRFVMIKRTDSTGDWYVWDSARGIVAGNDPHLSLNTTAAEVTTDDSVDTDNTGFIVNQLSATNVNVTSATYIGLAIA